MFIFHGQVIIIENSSFAGFAALPTAAPDLAADELERAEALKVPIYLRPAPPPQSVIDTYYTGNFSSEVTRMLSTAGWGWHIETAVHILRLIFSGALDRYPNLQIIIGHMDEAIPFMLQRIDLVLQPSLTNWVTP